MLFQTLGDELKFGNSGIEPWDTFCNFEIREIRPEKRHFLQNTLCAAGLNFGEIGTFSDIFFRNVTNLQKCKMQKTQNAKRPKHSEILCFYRK
jgi:hypothetical protein